MSSSTGKGPCEAVSERVASLLARRILNAELPAGARIKQDELAEELSISRIPVRDALRILEARGLVTMRANAGARVVVLNENDVRSSFDIRERIEPLLLADSLSRFTAQDIAELRALLDEREASPDLAGIMEQGRAFHWMTYRRHASPLLASILERVWDVMHSYVLVAHRAMEAEQRAVALRSHGFEHEVLYQAIARGEVETAQAALVLHIRRVRAAVIDTR
ncbi:GntR family transcriptional regulator [Novosphingobium sp. 1949]|uniref:GntR family transcriptional regulator n=1 Tax=Novosphingobium organovorum TaxID=2930092 RepID=A0ABT0B950_9SPHN|nr:GntR family transcriptional regulator [Novosphingobium organovorum]MCJ2181383.1 GntR family transcriptional regulator [Novosphingobium organovorum]